MKLRRKKKNVHTMIIRIQLISDRKTAIKLLNLPMSQAIKTLKDIIAVK
jgi:predicted transcriptional regulator of viral defense system